MCRGGGCAGRVACPLRGGVGHTERVCGSGAEDGCLADLQLTVMNLGSFSQYLIAHTICTALSASALSTEQAMGNI